jgi:hypothetical protein
MEPIPESEILYPGDLVDVEYEVRQTGLLTDMAIAQIKRDLWADERFDYQGSRWETRVDKSGLDGTIVEREFLIITVLVRTTPKTQQPQEQRAGLGPVAVIAVVTLLGAAVIVAAGALIYHGHSITRAAQIETQTTQAVLGDPNLTPEQKTEVLTAQANAAKSGGGGLAAIGSSVFVAGILIGVIYLFTRTSGRGGRMAAYQYD